MGVLDEDGRLFGVVNVVDAFAALLLVSVFAAGIALVGPFGPGGADATRYATVQFDRQPGYVAEQLSAGDRMPAGQQGGSVTVADVYVTEDGDSTSSTNVTVYARLAVDGRLVERRDGPGPVFTYGGDPLVAGSPFTLTTANYTVAGRVVAVSTSGTSLNVARTPVRIETTVPTRVAESVETGDVYRLAGRRVATVTDVQSYPTADPDRQTLSLGVELRTIPDGGLERFAGRPVRLGSTVPFRTDSYDLSGTVVQRGSATLPGTATETTAVVDLETVAPAVADELQVGDTETSRGRTLATVTDVRRSNATVVLTSESGNISANEHPVEQDVSLTVDLATRRTDGSVRFHGRQLTVGSRVTLDFGTVRINGTVARIQSP